MSAVADKYNVLQDLGVEVISISVDSVFVHKMWNDHELTKMVDGGVPFHMLSDQAGNIGRAYGVWDEAQGIELRRHGGDRIGLCPFHDDRNPSLVVTPSKNLWNFLGACGEGGTIVDWVMKTQGVSFRHAVEILRGGGKI